MMEWFGSYIKTIGAFLIFSVFAEMIMPDDNFRKYINIIVGFLMVVTILKPVSQVLTKDGFDFSNIINKYESTLSQNFSGSEYKSTKKMQKEIVTQVYREEMNSRMTEKLADKGFINIEAQAFLEEETDSEDYGKITKADIKCSLKKGESVEETKSSIEKIINDEYSVPLEKIYVTVK